MKCKIGASFLDELVCYCVNMYIVAEEIYCIHELSMICVVLNELRYGVQNKFHNYNFYLDVLYYSPHSNDSG
jgi:hypothetical protein